MIIKNESDVIERSLGSVKKLIDYWVIIDTGSTDGTQEIVKKFMKDIPGELHERKWVNFAHNRNEALDLAKDKGDYILFIDADEILEYSADFTLPPLDKDCYYMTVRQVNAVDVNRSALIKASLPWKWEGILHETVSCSEAKTFDKLKGVINWCNTGPRSGRSKNLNDTEKYYKDALVFEEALKKEPENSRYAYYLGQSYLAAEKYDLARKAFEKRVAMPSTDVQETYLALYDLGIIEEKVEHFDAAIENHFKAYNFRPSRAEPLFRIATLYRKKGNYLLGYLLSKFALTIPYPEQDACVEYATYDYALLIEYANCTLLLGRFQEGLQACLKLLGNPNLPAEIREKVLANCEVARSNLFGSEEFPEVKKAS